MSRLGAPTRVVTILEGESLINDAVALTAFSLAVEAMAHPFTVEHALLRLVQVVIGGIAYGLAVAVVIGRVRHHVRDPALQILITLITPFVAYIPAEEQLNVSGVLATVVAGVYLGTRTEGMLQPASRVSGTMFWRTLIFLLESALFVLLGLDLRAVVSELSTVISFARLAGAAAAVVGAIIVIRLVWELAVSPLIRFLPGEHSMFVVNPWRYRLVIGWGGMRGAIYPGHRAHAADHGERGAVRGAVGAHPAGGGRRGGHAARRGADAGAAGAVAGAGARPRSISGGRRSRGRG